MTDTYQDILVESIGAVHRISMNRPHARNAQGRRLLDELHHALNKARGNDDIRVIILAGTGDHFSAGHDLKEAQAERAGFSVEERWAYESSRYYSYSMDLRDFPKPTIAQVQGACIAGAFMLANMCDLIVASEDAYFSDPVCHTLAVSSVEALVHPWVMNLRRAKEFLFTGEPIKADEAKLLGLVNRVVARAKLEEETLAMASRIAAAPPFALQLLKRSLNRAEDAQGFRLALEAHFDAHQLTHVTNEFRAAGERSFSSALSKGKSIHTKL